VKEGEKKNAGRINSKNRLRKDGEKKQLKLR
jgi:hypothetical protein